MTLGTYVSRERAPPIPDEIRGPNGETVVTAKQVRTGKKAFQANRLMNQGSVLGNGSYFRVDLTADALELEAEYMREYYARQRESDSFDSLPEGDRAAVERRVERELDADAPEGEIARYSAAEVYAHRRLREAYVDRYYGGAPEGGFRRVMSTRPRRPPESPTSPAGRPGWPTPTVPVPTTPTRTTGRTCPRPGTDQPARSSSGARSASSC
ncbi:hypothetical protein [Haloterrigena salifodinae]|nr:hypothetical protein [Haloterrigena salifodinae]